MEIRNVLKISHANAVQISCSSTKIHNMMCIELSRILDKVINILPDIESAKPGSTIGIKTLCSLNASIEKGKLIIQYCSESSKLYLALTGKTILGRCKRVNNSLIQNLFQIQSMVPLVLASQIAEIIVFLENTKFEIDPKEEVAGEAILKLLSQKNSSEELESNTLQITALNLNLNSPKSILIEKRSIKRLLEQISGIDPKKENVLNFLLYLIKKYSKNIQQGFDKLEENYEKNYECILHDSNFNSVSSLKNVCVSLLEGRIENYDNSSTNSSDLSKPEDQSEICSQFFFPWSTDYGTDGNFSRFNPEKFVNFLKDLSLLKREKREKAVEDVKMVLEGEIETCYLMLSNGFGEGLIEFLKISRDLSDEIAQKIGAQLFLAFLRNNRVEFPTLSEEILEILPPFIDQETREALSILQKFSQYFNNYSNISYNSPSKHLSSDDINIMEICMETLCDISCQNNITESQVFSSGYLNSLASILSLDKLTECSFKVLQIMSCLDEGARLISQNPKFISCLVELLETGRSEEKEFCLNIIYNLCSKTPESRLIVVDECAVPALVLLSVNGNEGEKEMSRKLLQLLKDLRDDECETSTSMESCTSEKISSKSDLLLVKKKGFLSRFRPLALF
ncbi:hypothetical protein LUZ60_013568 [Juncus effusus]|nr:hypothetical protein LUZ60_013568 [Juncus effusus]